MTFMMTSWLVMERLGATGALSAREPVRAKAKGFGGARPAPEGPMK
jgi:hypothetical protein